MTSSVMRSLCETLIILFLYLCALNAKEMAAVLPALLICYEIVYSGITGPWRRWRTILALALMSAAYMLPKLLVRSPLTEGYQPHYSIARLVDNWRAYIGEIFYR